MLIPKQSSSLLYGVKWVAHHGLTLIFVSVQIPKGAIYASKGQSLRNKFVFHHTMWHMENNPKGYRNSVNMMQFYTIVQNVSVM